MKRRLKTPEMIAREEETNRARIKNGFEPFPKGVDYIRGEWDEGYCMSIGCTCTTEDAMGCSLFTRFDESRVKKDFIYHALGWETSSCESDRCQYKDEK